MGVIKCVKCGTYLYDDEVVWVKINDNHEAAYCVSCSPDDSVSYDESDYD